METQEQMGTASVPNRTPDFYLARIYINFLHSDSIGFVCPRGSQITVYCGGPSGEDEYADLTSLQVWSGYKGSRFVDGVRSIDGSKHWILSHLHEELVIEGKSTRRSYVVAHIEQINLNAFNRIDHGSNGKAHFTLGLKNLLVDFDGVTEGQIPALIAWLENLELPFSFSVFSGKKGLHILICLDRAITDGEYANRLCNALIESLVLAEADAKWTFDGGPLFGDRKYTSAARLPGLIRTETGIIQSLVHQWRGYVAVESLETWLDRHVPDWRTKTDCNFGDALRGGSFDDGWDDDDLIYDSVTDSVEENSPPSQSRKPQDKNELMQLPEPEPWEDEKYTALATVDQDFLRSPFGLAKAGFTLNFIGRELKAGRISLHAGKFSGVMQLVMNSKKPIVTATCRIHPQESGPSLVNTIGPLSEEVLRRVDQPGNRVIAIAAGGGKSTILRESIARQIVAPRWNHKTNRFDRPFESALILVERVEDVIWLRHYLNQGTSGYGFEARPFHDSDGNLLRKMNSQSDYALAPDPEDVFNEFEAQGRTTFEAATYMDQNPSLFFRVEALVSFNRKICLRDDFPDKDEKVPANFCHICTYHACSANYATKKEGNHTFAPVLLGTHRGFLLNPSNFLRYRSQRHRSSLQNRNAIFIDEKPPAFAEHKVELTKVGMSGRPTFTLSPLDELQKLTSDDLEIQETLKQVHHKLRSRLKDAGVSNRISSKKSDSSFVTIGKGAFLNCDEFRHIRSALRKKIFRMRVQSDSDDFHNLLSAIESIKILTEDQILFRYTRRHRDGAEILSAHAGYNHWSKFNDSGISLNVLDATAEFDPDYSLPGAPPIDKIDTGVRYPNLVIRVLFRRDHGKKKAYQKDKAHHISSIASTRTNEILVITDKASFTPYNVQFSSSKNISVDYFGNLKGKNDYRHCNHIYLTHSPRFDEMSYLTRLAAHLRNSLLLRNKWIRTLDNKRYGDSLLIYSRSGYAVEFRDPCIESFRLQVDCAELIQTIMRSHLRQDPNASVVVWFPGSNPALIGRLLDYFRGARIDTSLIN